MIDHFQPPYSQSSPNRTTSNLYLSIYLSEVMNKDEDEKKHKVKVQKVGLGWVRVMGV